MLRGARCVAQRNSSAYTMKTSCIFFLSMLLTVFSVQLLAFEQVGPVSVRVRPDRADWTYAVGEPVKFHVSVVRNEHPLNGVQVHYSVGPEKMPAESRTLTVPAEGLWIEGGTMAQPGFLRCSAEVNHEGRTYRSMATAGFDPEKIQPTQTEPEDFDAFWQQGMDALKRIPLDVRIQLISEASTGKINVYHVSIRTWGQPVSEALQTRVYGILCEPKAPGKYPVILRPPGAGIRPYSGERELAEKGAITFEIGIHGIPVDLPKEVYDQLRAGPLSSYQILQLENRERYYYRRVYLACVRANDFLVSRPSWDGENVVVWGGSQGGQLALVTAALDPRITIAAVNYPAYCDVTGYLHGRAGGWPHLLSDPDDGHRTPEKIATTAYYDAVNFARRIKVPIRFSASYNDTTCPPTSTFAAYNVITAPKELALDLERGHSSSPESSEATTQWVLRRAGQR